MTRDPDFKVAVFKIKYDVKTGAR